MKKNESARILVGDRVRFELVKKPVEGIVVEDRGNLGKGGRQLLRVCVETEDSEPMYIELPIDELERVSDSAQVGEK